MFWSCSGLVTHGMFKCLLHQTSGAARCWVAWAPVQLQIYCKQQVFCVTVIRLAENTELNCACVQEHARVQSATPDAPLHSSLSVVTAEHTRGTQLGTGVSCVNLPVCCVVLVVLIRAPTNTTSHLFIMCSTTVACCLPACQHTVVHAVSVQGILNKPDALKNILQG